jgi:hypothetical protein
MNCVKLIFLCLLSVTASTSFAQQPGKDSLPGYIKQARYFKLSGFPDSAVYFKNWILPCNSKDGEILYSTATIPSENNKAFTLDASKSHTLRDKQ